MKFAIGAWVKRVGVGVNGVNPRGDFRNSWCDLTRKIWMLTARVTCLEQNARVNNCNRDTLTNIGRVGEFVPRGLRIHLSNIPLLR